MEDNLCSICLQPKTKETSGSLTQWVSACRCDLISLEEELFQTLKSCRLCHKRISLTSHGSFTQWIFRSDLCTCHHPEPVIESDSEEAPTSSSDCLEPVAVTYPALELDGVDFPGGRYQPIEEIGRGSVSTVYRALDKLLNKVVAVKLIGRLDPDLVVSFQAEAKIISQLKHENIVEVLDISSTEAGTPYMVLEYCPGVTLAEFLQQEGPQPLELCIDIMIQILYALDHAHSRQPPVYHRDLKPANVLLTRDEAGHFSIKLIDFGIATNSGSQSGGSIAGTLPYMSPDQARGLMFDQRSEIYSAGCVFFELLTGRPPYSGDDPVSILADKIQVNKDFADELQKHILDSNRATELDAILKRCLSPDLDKRFQSTREFIVHLSSFLNPEKEAVRTGLESSKRSDAVAFISLLFGLAALAGFAYVWTGAPFFQSDDSVTQNSFTRPEVEQEGNYITGKIFSQTADFGVFRDLSEGTVQAAKLSDNNSLNKIKDRRDIQHLILNHSMVDGKGLKYLTEMPLVSLHLDGLPIVDSDIKTLASIKTLRCLNLGRSNITGVGLDSLKSLVFLKVSRTDLNDEGLQAILRMKKLESLTLSASQCSTSGIKRFFEQMHLKKLTIFGNDIKPEQLTSLRRSRTLEQLEFDGRNVSAKDIQALYKFPVKRLTFTFTSSIAGSAFRHPRSQEALKSLTRLKEINLLEGMLDYRRLAELKNLLPNCKISLNEPLHDDPDFTRGMEITPEDVNF